MKPILPKPDFPGTVDGQVRTLPIKVPTGQLFMYRAPSGDMCAMRVKEVQLSVQWVWDAREREWVDDRTWKSRRPAPNEGKVLVSKHSSMHKMLATRQRRQRRSAGKK